MPEYLVTWQVDVSADSPIKAALEAEDIQRHQIIMRTEGGVFKVLDKSTKVETFIDLEEYYTSKNLG